IRKPIRRARTPTNVQQTEAPAPDTTGTNMGNLAKPVTEGAVELSKKWVHETPQKALEEVGNQFNHWSGKLTENSLQMCYALIGANWVVYGSVGQILQSQWAKLSLLMVILTLAINV